LKYRLIGSFSNASSWEYIVVGAGSGGSVVAGRLAEAGHRVLLVEAGGNKPWIGSVPGLVALLQKSPVDWAYTTEPSKVASLGTGGVSLWPRGKLLGGSSILNYMLYVRGNSREHIMQIYLSCHVMPIQFQQ